MTASALWAPNTTTADDLTAAWVGEALGRSGGAAAQRWLFPLLTRTANEQGIPAGLPASAMVVHKVGTFSGTENDSAYIVNGPTAYVLSVAVDGIEETAGWSLIAQISARIWQYESSRPDYVAPMAAMPVASPARQNRH
jgi:beta-lactamase class A